MSPNYDTLIGVTLFLVVALGFLCITLSEPIPVDRHRITRTPMDSGLWPSGLAHDEPPEPLSVFSAHKAMQLHRQCAKAHCPRKAAAYSALVDAGHIGPVAR
jgi:hypothetical protein